MKLAIFSDIHGNINYFRSCLLKMSEYQIDKYVFLGDAVGYMPYAVEVLELLNSINADCLLGNHEAMMCNMLDYSSDKDEIYKLKNTASLMPEHIYKQIKTWLPYKINTFDNINILFVHGSPWNPLAGYIYPDSLERYYDNPQYDFIFIGHSHYPFISKNIHSTIVNVGSIGLPRDSGDMPSFVIWDTIANDLRIIRIKVDIQELILDLKEHNVHEEVLDCLNRNSQEELFV